MARTHYFPEDRIHYVWDNEQDPVLTVEPGDTVVYHTREVSDGQIGPDSDAGVLEGLDWERVYPLAGPVAMADAEPGDILAVEVLDIRTQGWGWTAVIPGLGLLPEDFPDAYLKVFDLTNGDYTFFKDDIIIPIEPFFGTMGVNEDLMQAAKDSLRAMVEHVSTTYGLDPVEAYLLASLVVDLKISEIVDQPNWIVSSYLLLAICGLPWSS